MADDTGPILRVRASGFSGSGYRTIFDDPKGVVPGVTTVLGALQKPGLDQWRIDQTVARAVVDIDGLLSMTEEQGFNRLRFYWKRKPDFDNPNTDLRSWHRGVLDDLADTGRWIHSFIEADLNDWFEPEPLRAEHEQMANAYLLWKADQDIEVYQTEATVFGEGYAGTADLFAKINGEVGCWDVKSSKRVYDSHVSQLSALGAAHTLAKQVTADTEDAVEYETKAHGKTYWRADPMPPIANYGVIQCRFDDYDNSGTFIPAQCSLHKIPQEQIDVSYDLFRGALHVRHAEAKLKKLMKAADDGA